MSSKNFEKLSRVVCLATAVAALGVSLDTPATWTTSRRVAEALTTRLTSHNFSISSSDGELEALRQLGASVRNASATLGTHVAITHSYSLSKPGVAALITRNIRAATSPEVTVRVIGPVPWARFGASPAFNGLHTTDKVNIALGFLTALRLPVDDITAALEEPVLEALHALDSGASHIDVPNSAKPSRSNSGPEHAVEQALLPHFQGLKLNGSPTAAAQNTDGHETWTPEQEHQALEFLLRLEEDAPHAKAAHELQYRLQHAFDMGVPVRDVFLEALGTVQEQADELQEKVAALHLHAAVLSAVDLGLEIEDVINAALEHETKSVLPMLPKDADDGYGSDLEHFAVELEHKLMAP